MEDDYFTHYFVRPCPTDREYCTDSSAHSRYNVHVSFSHLIDDVGYEEESHIICLRDDVLAEGSEDDCRDIIFSEGLSNWPINAGTVRGIIDEVIEIAREYKCTIQVDMRTYHMRDSDDDQETYEDDDRDFGAAAEGSVNGDAAAASGGGFIVKSLKRKRIDDEYGGNCCGICLEELTAGTDVAVMPCSHCSFHDDCLSSWLERSPSCPLCRRKMPAAAAADSNS